MSRAEAIQRHLATAQDRETLFTLATAIETGCDALVPVDFLPTIYLALKRWIPYTTAGTPASVATPLVADYIYEQMSEGAQAAIDRLLEHEDTFQREWEGACE